MKILAIKWRRLGDTALWTAALRALIELKPSFLDIALPEKYNALFHEDPRFNRQFLLSERFSENRKVLRNIRAVHYDAVLNFHASSRSIQLSVLSGAKKRIIHHHSRSPKFLLRQFPIPNLGKPMSAIERDLNVVRALGWSGKSPGPLLLPASSLIEEGRLALGPLNKLSDKSFIALNVGASRSAKRWPLENYISLARSLRELGPVIFFHEGPLPFEGNFLTEVKKWASFVPTQKLSTLIGCLSLARCYIGSDSGVKHIAAALGIPTVTLFGPESIGEWHGYAPEKHRAIQIPLLCRYQDPTPVEFSWCGESICPMASHACMTLITPERVSTEVQQLLLR